jgi:hypothetical protein
MSDETEYADDDRGDRYAPEARSEKPRDAVKTARKVRSFVDATKRDGNSVKRFDNLVEQGNEALDEVVSADGLDSRSALKIAREQTKGKAQRVLTHVEKIADDGVGLGSIAAIAASDDIPMNENLRTVFKAYDSQVKGGKADLDKIASVPGMIVNKETGDVNLFGLEFLPVPVQYASMLSVGYTLGVSMVNRWVFNKAFKGGNALTTAIGANHYIDPQKAGKIAGYGSIALTTHWPDFNIFWQSRRNHQQKVEGVTTQLAPILEQLKGSHSAGAFYGVKKDENEVIYNERQRLNNKHNAEIYRNAVQALGRSAVFVASAMDGKQSIEGLTPEVVNAAALKTLDKEKYSQIASKTKELQELGLSRKEAFESARTEVMGAPKEAPKDTGVNTASDFRNYAAVLVTLAAQAVGNAVFGKRVGKLQPVSAYDMIATLRKHLDEDPKQSAFPLPQGMRVEGAKGSAADELKLEDYIVQIFQQHERDCGGDDARIPSRLESKVQDAAKIIATELREGRLDGMALVNLVGERKLVRNSGKTVADEGIVHREVDRLRALLRHTEWVDPDKYIADASFSKQELKNAWKGMDDKEKNIFVSLVPTQVLESAGIKPDDVRQRRQMREKEFDKDVIKVLKGAIALGDDQLKKHSITPEEIELFHEAAGAVKEKGEEGILTVMPGAGRHKNVGPPLTELVVRHMQYGGKLGDLVQQGMAVQ